MRASPLLIVCWFFAAPVSSAFGHGDPIVVKVINDQLVASHDPARIPPNIYPSNVFAQEGEAGNPNPFVTFLPSVGEIVFWELPGMNISGMDNDSSLSIEPLTRGIDGTTPAEQRLLWYWNPESQLVEPSQADFFILGTGQRFAALAADANTAPAPFLLANSMTGLQGSHNHGLAQWALSNEDSAPFGAYGFFARFVASNHAPTDPFLLLFNHGVDTESDAMLEAANAILAAVADDAGLAGDYNNDGAVNAADYTVWRNNLNDPTEADIHHNGDGTGGVDAADYAWWKQHYGDASPGSGGLARVVPEPSALLLALNAAAALLVSTRGGRPRIRSATTARNALTFWRKARSRLHQRPLHPGAAPIDT